VRGDDSARGIERRPARTATRLGGPMSPVSPESSDVPSARGRSRVFAGTRGWAVLLVTVVAALLVLPPIGQRVIATGGYNGDDEARSALLARDVIDRGVLFDVHYRWESPFRDKPPLYPWLIAACSLLGGRVTEGTARAPVALATIGVALFVFLLGEQLFGRRAGVWAALIAVTSYDVFANSQLVLPDMLVVCFATAAGWALWRAMSHPSARSALPLFYVAIALSVYAKGPLGLVPFLTAAVWISTEYGVRQVVARLWSLPGAALFAGITLSWLGPFLALGARSWLQSSVWGDWLTWYFGVPGSGPELLYTVMVGFLPWTVLAPLVIADALRAWKTPAVRFALLWFAVPLVVLMASANFKPRYSLSAYPGAALLVGWWADARGTARTRAGRVLGSLALIGFLVLAASLNIPRWWHPRVRAYLPGLSWELVPVVIGLGAIGGAFFWGLRRGRPALLVHGTVLATAVTLGYGIWPYTTRYNELWNFKQFAGAVDRHARGAEAAVFRYRSDEWMSLDFYLARPPLAIETVAELRGFLSRPDRPVAVIEARDWPTVRLGLASDVRALEEMRIGRQKLLIVSGGG
jgi:4-amino-4-deoxy-L-arabinose transferase-like glycosyltransferase